MVSPAEGQVRYKGLVLTGVFDGCSCLPEAYIQKTLRSGLLDSEHNTVISHWFDSSLIHARARHTLLTFGWQYAEPGEIPYGVVPFENQQKLQCCTTLHARDHLQRDPS